MNHRTRLFLIGMIGLLVLSSFIRALPAGPIVNYISNTTSATVSVNRSVDAKGTITTITLSASQQDYKWKAYVGNVTGKLALDDANGKSIYDWALGGTGAIGEVYVSRASSVNWNNVSCVNQSVLDSEQTAMGMIGSSPDSINSTFNYTSHKTFKVATVNITTSSCRSTATYLNDTAQTVNETALFQEVLLKDDILNTFVYATIIEPTAPLGFDGANKYDFQMLVAENESSTVPTLYYFYLELG